jgi:hypothetical protein
VDHEVTAENGSFLFKASIDNGSSNRDDFVDIIFRDGHDNAITSKVLQIDKGDTNYAATIYGSFSTDWDAGTTFRVYANSDNDSVVRGNIMLTGMKVTEAQAAPVTAMATAEKSLVFDDSIGRRPTLADITGALGASGQGDLVEANFTALGTNESQTRYWQVFYDHIHDAFFTHELFKAVY